MQRPQCGMALSTEADSCLRLAAPATEMEGDWLSRPPWEVSCGPLVCILCVTSYLTLLQVMGILKHKLAI